MGYTSYLWDPVSDCVLQEYDGDENLTAEYTNEPSPFGPVLSQHRNGTTSDLLADALGSTRLIADDSGAVTDSFVYDAWGQELDRTGTPETPYRWVGQWGYQTDDELESVYVRARTYMPMIARWISIDPLFLLDSMEKYEYSNNSPASNGDPSGALTVTRNSSINPGPCGKYEVLWKFVLDNPAPCDGYIVQKVVRITKLSSCFICDCSHAEEDELVFWEAFKVNKGDRTPPPLGQRQIAFVEGQMGRTEPVPVGTTYSEFRDKWGSPGFPGKCGFIYIQATSKFFCKSDSTGTYAATGELDRSFAGTVYGRRLNLNRNWMNGRSVRHSGMATSTDREPDFWGQSAVEEEARVQTNNSIIDSLNLGLRTLSTTWRCCRGGLTHVLWALEKERTMPREEPVGCRTNRSCVCVGRLPRSSSGKPWN